MRDHVGWKEPHSGCMRTRNGENQRAPMGGRKALWPGPSPISSQLPNRAWNCTETFTAEVTGSIPVLPTPRCASSWAIDRSRRRSDWAVQTPRRLLRIPASVGFSRSVRRRCSAWRCTITFLALQRSLERRGALMCERRFPNGATSEPRNGSSLRNARVAEDVRGCRFDRAPGSWASDLVGFHRISSWCLPSTQDALRRRSPQQRSVRR